MTERDKPEFARVMNGMGAMWGRELTREVLTLWWAAMSDWTIEDFRAAAGLLVKRCQFMPTPRDFEQLKRAGEQTAGEAWSDVLSGAALDPSGRAYRAARIAGGGQAAIRRANVNTELPWIQKRFMAAYAELTEVDEVREALPQVAAPPRLDGILKALR